MFVRRRKSFRYLLDCLRILEADRDDLETVRCFNEVLLDELLRAEAAIERHRVTHRELKTRLRLDRSGKETSKSLKARIKRYAGYIDNYEDAIYLWKSFGDAIAHIYLDGLSIKHAYFEIDGLDVKRDAGRISGKTGIRAELAFLHQALDAGVPAVLCDLTHVLRYGDVCLLGAADPVMFEVKSGSRLNRRGQRQLKTLERLHTFFENDRTENFRGLKGEVVRVAVENHPRDNVDALNKCIGRAKAAGLDVCKPEPGVTYIAIYGATDLPDLFDRAQKGPRLAFLLNSDKNERAWAPYRPFLLTIKAHDDLLDFISGKLYLIVLVDPQVLCEAMAGDGWLVRFRDHPNYPIQCLHRETKAYSALSSQFLKRAAYEFISLSWMGEVQRPNLPRLEELIGEHFAETPQVNQVDWLKNELEPGDPWLDKLED